MLNRGIYATLPAGIQGFLLRNKEKNVAPFCNFHTTNAGRAKPPAYGSGREGPARGMGKRRASPMRKRHAKFEEGFSDEFEGAWRTSDR
jgi:hypothetical protein